MGTRSTIGVKENGNYKLIYCHWDGYYDNNGMILHKHYQDIDKVKQLIELGDLSSLNKNVEGGEEEDRCVSYIRDLGGDIKCDCYQEALEKDVNNYLGDYWDREYLYIYDCETKTWMTNQHKHTDKLKPLYDTLKKEQLLPR